ncbi:hypothetical protein JW799_18215 [Cohnella algarum]|nr:hypothetical protein [Cohnella algarum]
MTGQLHQCQNIVQQLINQTQQATQMYQQMLQQEQQNAARLEELAQREQRAVQMIQTALHGHQTAIQQMNQVSQMCRQLEQSVQHINTQTFSSTVQPLQSYGASSYGTSASAGMTNRSFQ